MPTSADAELLVDTSVAVALMVSDHEHHEAVTLAGVRLGLSGHAAFETFSVLTRLPPPLRRTPGAVGRMLSSNFVGSRFLEGAAAGKLLERLPGLGIAGGAVYDALVGAAAAHQRMRLATRDRRALDTYRALDVELEILA